MKRKINNMKKIVLLLMMVFLICFIVDGHCSRTDFKEGDIIFQTSKSEQSKYISIITQSRLTHCGIIIEKNNGFYVLEASNVIKLTPINEFINKGVNNAYWIKRIIDQPVKIKYRNLLGRKYDSRFKWNNNLYYCSELVYHIYDSQFNIKLGTPKKVKDYKGIHLFKNYINKRGIDIEELVLSPKDIYDYE